MKLVHYFAVLGILMVLIAGCSAKSDKEKAEETEHAGHGDAHTLPNGDLQETTSSAEELPAFLNDKNDDMRTIYLAAAQHPDILASMPCYCGCSDAAGHKSNLNCFVADISKDKVVWDDHGTRCGVCLEIAAESIMMSQDGKSLKEIRQYIDEKYKEGYAKPTPTPMPA